MKLLQSILLAAGCLTAIAPVVQAEQLELDGFGVYIKDGDHYQRLKSFKHLRMDYEYLSELVRPSEKPEAVELVVYAEDIDSSSVALEARPLSVPGQSLQLTPIFSPISDDQLRIRFEEALPDDRLILVQAGWGQNSVYGVALDNPLTHVMEYYSKDTDASPTTAEWATEKAMKAYPNSAELKKLHGYWQTAVMQGKADQQYQLVMQSWQRYEKENSVDARIKALKLTSKRIDKYTEEYPQGKQFKELAKLQKKVMAKLDV